MTVIAVVVACMILMTSADGDSGELTIPTSIPSEIPAEIPDDESNAVAIVDGKYYSDTGEALNAAKGSFDKYVGLIGTCDYTIDVDSCVLIALSNNVSEDKVSFADGMLVFSTKLSFGGSKYSVYAVYNKDYLFGQIVDSINGIGIENVSVVYDGESVDVSLKSQGNLSDIADILTKEVILNVLDQFFPVALVSDRVTLDGVTVYDGKIRIESVSELIKQNEVTFTSLANATSKTLVTYTLSVESKTTSFELPISLTLDCTDAQFNWLKDKAAKAAAHSVFEYKDGSFNVMLDVRSTFEKVFASRIEKYGYKAVREKINSMTLKELVEACEGKKLPAKYAEYQDVYDDMVVLAKKVIARIEQTRFKDNIDGAVGVLDADNDGTYIYKNSISFSTSSVSTRLQRYIDKYFPDYSPFIDVKSMIDDREITVKGNITIVAFDQYTATFTDVEGNVIYTVTLVEGDTPIFNGEDPAKPSTTQYLYVFSGWSDGTNEYGKNELCALTKDVTFTPVFEELSIEQLNEELKFSSAAVLFEDSLSIKFYASKAVLGEYDAFYAKVVFNGEEYILEGEENGAYYQFIFTEVAAKEMSDEFTITLYAEKTMNDTVVTEFGADKVYSIREYAMNMLANEASSDEFKTLLVDVLVYGAQAQKYFGYNTDDLATALLTAEQLAYATAETPDLGSDFSYTNKDDMNTVFIGASLVFENTLGMNIIIDVSKYEGDISDLTLVIAYTDIVTGEVVTIDAVGSELVANNAYYTYKLDGLSVRELRTVITAIVYDAYGAPVSGTLEYSMSTYIYNKVGSESPIVDLAIATIKYADSAFNYFRLEM